MSFPKRHIILISGFTQSTRTVHGLVNLSVWLWETIKGKGSLLWAPPLTWHIDIDAALGFIQNAGIDGEAMVIGYSYGGSRAVELVRALDARGIRVPYLVLVDPVLRPKNRPLINALLGWFRLWRNIHPFVIPANVGEVHHYYQRIQWPYGFPVAARNPKATIIHSTPLVYPHVDMDDAMEVHEKVIALADRFVKGEYTRAAA